MDETLEFSRLQSAGIWLWYALWLSTWWSMPGVALLLSCPLMAVGLWIALRIIEDSYE